MTAPTADRQALPEVPAGVLEFATKHNVAQFLRPLLAMTRDIFPNQSLALVLEEDPEIADYYTIAVQVEVSGWTADEMLEAHNNWTRRLFKVCPSTDVWIFRIAMVQHS